MSKKNRSAESKRPPSVPKVMLHLEGLAVLAACCFFYGRAHFSIGIFALGFLAPDLAMIGYVANKSVGAACYNWVHTYVVPVVLAAFLYYTHREGLMWIPLIWASHIGFDRFLGYGLKYDTDFKSTHLQKV